MNEHHKDLCPMTETIHLLSKRWTLFILNQLILGPQRFSEIEGCMPISGRLLSERLKELEIEEIVKRTLYPEMPVRVEYELTEKGKAFQPILTEIRKWSQTWGIKTAGTGTGCETELQKCPSMCEEEIT